MPATRRLEKQIAMTRIYCIRHWFRLPLAEKGIVTFRHTFTYTINSGTRRHPRVENVIFEGDAIELEDAQLLEFIAKYGPVMIHPSGANTSGSWDYWSIWVTDETGCFNQK